MKSCCRFLAVTCALVGLAASGALAGVADTDLSWVAKLPGLSGGVQNKVGDEIKIVYSFTGDTETTVNLLYAGLEGRGWKVTRNAVLSALGVTSFEGAKARKGTARLNIAVMGTVGAKTLALRLYGGTTSAPTSSGGRASIRAHDSGAVVIGDETGSVSIGADGSLVVRDEATGDTVSTRNGRVHIKEGGGESVTVDAGGVTIGRGSASGRRIVVTGNDVTRTVRCEGGEVVSVSGNDNRVTLKGACGILNMSGNDNDATVLGSIEKIVVSGVENSVGWDPDANPHPPAITKSGVENRVYRMGE